MTQVYIVAAKRTAVVPRNGVFREVETTALAAPLIAALLDTVQMAPAAVDYVILGNALYGGGNPARLAALAAGLPVETPSVTIDTQCCAGLDSVIFGASLIASGQARAVIAGGVESFSRSPLRARRPICTGGSPAHYDRPPFTPWPEADPDMIEAAAAFAAERDMVRDRQEAYAVASHAKAVAARTHLTREIVPVAGLSSDAFTRDLSLAVCRRMPVLAGDRRTGLSAATVAVEADAAAAVLLTDESLANAIVHNATPLRFVAGRSAGGDPMRPGLAAIASAKGLLAEERLTGRDMAVVEIMEAFAVQAMAFVEAMNLPAEAINRSGGALARGHPIGASGAILAVRLFHELQRENSRALGLAAIAAAGGLGSAILAESA